MNKENSKCFQELNHEESIQCNGGISLLQKVEIPPIVIQIPPRDNENRL